MDAENALSVFSSTYHINTSHIVFGLLLPSPFARTFPVCMLSRMTATWKKVKCPDDDDDDDDVQ